MLQPIKLSCEYQTDPLVVDEALPRYGWQFSGDGKVQVAYRLKVTQKNKLIWDSGRTESARCVHVVYAGPTLASFTKYTWQVTVWDDRDQEASAFSVFSTGSMDGKGWKARWVGKQCDGPFYLRKRFQLKKKPASASLYASALGVYMVFVNGKKAGSSYFDPGWTDYHQRIQYQTFDVAPLLQAGENEIIAVVADGWYCGNIAIVGREMYGSYPLYFFAQLKGDGVAIATDMSWEASMGPLVSSDLQSGEEWDFTRQMEWTSVYIQRLDLTARLCAQKGAQIENIQVLKARKLASKDGIQMFDFGQNFVGWARVAIKGMRGQRVTLRHGEMLTDEGDLYTGNLRTATQTDIFTLADSEHTLCEPMFTYHGFRYMEVSGANEIDVEDVTGICLSAALPQTMQFMCSDNRVNKLWYNTIWSQRGNFYSVPTDCPQRDERMGWTGDAQVFCKSACYNMDSAAYYEKYLRDLFDAQLPDGAVTDVVPDVHYSDGRPLVHAGNAAWGDAAFIIPYTLYQMYGDIRPVEIYYPNMQRYLEFLIGTTHGLIRPDHGFGDWLSINADTPKDLLSTAYFALSASLMAQMANLLGKRADQSKYQELFHRIAEAFRQRFVAADGMIAGNTQTGYLLALQFGLLTEALRPLALEQLVRNIHQQDCHLTTGFVGVSFLLPVLSQNGLDELAYQLLRTTTYPSWLYPVVNGATTIWERWNSYTKTDGFGDEGMNSFNHYSLGSVVEWLYAYAAGIIIRHDATNHPNITIAPHMHTLDWLEAKYDSVYGPIRVRWEGSSLQVDIPAGQCATVLLPDGAAHTAWGGSHHYVILKEV